MLRLPAHEIDALVDGDAVEPTVETRSLLEGVEALIGFEEDLLRQVEGIVGVGHNRADHAVDTGAVAQIELVENGGIA